MPKTNYKYLDQRAFAKLVGVSQQAVSGALRRGTLVWSFSDDGKKDGINPKEPKNVAYIDRIQNSNSGNRRDVQIAKNAERQLSGDTSSINIGNGSGGGHLAPSGDPNQYTQAFVDNKVQQAELNRTRIAKVQIELAKEMKELLPLKYVKKWWDIVSGSLHNNILSLGDSLADELAAICGVTDPAVVEEVRESIDKALVSSLSQVQSKALEFPDIIGLNS